jgi:Xaa-Pro aminopeptidase
MDIVHRIPSLRARLPDAGCDALLVTKLENVRYLTGFSGSAAMLFVSDAGTWFVSDGRYGDQAAAQLRSADVDATLTIGEVPDQLDILGRIGEGVARIGLEANACSWSQKIRFDELFATSECVATMGLVEQQRIVKDDGELARIERACDIADISLAQVKHRLIEGVTESVFAAELEFEMRQRGAAGASFDTIVASGPNGAMPHARPTDRPICPGELVVIDFGAIFDGYHSDMTRTLCVGEPEKELADLMDAVLAAQRAGLRAVEKDIQAGEVDAASRTVLKERGYGEFFVHSTGHGIGLEVHEAPFVAAGSTDILRPGTVVTVEPGAYVTGRGGARIEDTVVVTDSGARILTKTTKDYTL